MNNGLMRLEELFGGRKCFTVPIYQRSYAWGETQLADFVEDLENQPADKPYFFGTVLLEEKPQQSDGFQALDIVDGQQRITTLAICISVLSRRLRSLGLEDDARMFDEIYLQYRKRKIRVLEQDRAFFDTYVVSGERGGHLDPDTPSQRRLLAARAFFEERTERLGSSKIAELTSKIGLANVLVYCVNDSAEAALVFETTNDRGKPLTTLEKTKSFLMYKTYLSAEMPQDHLEDLKSRFADIYRNYERIETQVEEDALLRYHFIANEQWTSTKSGAEYTRHLDIVKARLNGMLAEDRQPEALDFISRYSESINRTFASVRTMLTEPSENMRQLLALGRMAQFYPLLLKLFAVPREQKDVDRILRLLELISFRVYGIRRRRANSGQDTLYRLALDFDGDFDALSQQLKHFVHHWANKHEFRQYLESPTFYKDTQRPVQNYLFWHYENYLRRSQQPVAGPISIEALLSKDSRTKLSIEHIASQTPGKSAVIADGGGALEHSEKFRATSLHCIGNLTIDPTSANSSKRNIHFASKQSGYFAKAPFKTQNELEHFVDSTGRWSADSIKRRKKAIVQFVMAHWDPEST